MTTTTKKHEIGSVTLIETGDNNFALKQGSDMIFISIDEAREIAAHIEEA